MAGSVLLEVPIDKVVPAPDNIRRKADPTESLVASIRAQGIIEPLVATNGGDSYVLVAGERRLRAARIAGLTTVPLVVRDLDEAGRIECMLVENGEREDLTAMEEALAFERLVKLGRRQHDIVEAVGCSQSHVSKRLSLLKLPDRARSALEVGGLNVNDALELVKLAERPDLLDKAWKDGGAAGVANTVAREKAALDREKRVAVVEAELEDQGVAVIEHPGASSNWSRQSERPLAGQSTVDFPRLPVGLTVELHASEHPECHGASVNHSGDIVWVCLAPERHAVAVDNRPPADDPDTTDATATDAPEPDDPFDLRAAQQRAADATNASLARREAICRIVRGRPSKPAVTDYLLVRTLFDTSRNEVAADDIIGALGLDEWQGDDEWDAIESYAAEAGDHLVAAGLAAALIGTEYLLASLDEWAGDTLVERHFAFLTAHGHELSDFERAELAGES